MPRSFSYVLFAIVLLASTYLAWPRSPKTSSAPLPLPVETVVVRQGAMQSQLRLTGRVEPARQATLTAQVSAPVQFRHKQLGDPVRAGEMLLELDAVQARAQSAQARAAVDQAQAGYRRLQADLGHTQAEVASRLQVARSGLKSARAENQKQRNLTRPQELLSAQAGYESAQQQRQQAQKEWQRYQMLHQEGAVSDQESERTRLAFELASRQESTALQSLRLAREGSRSEDRLTAAAGLETARAGVQLAAAGPLQIQSLRQQLAASAGSLEQQQAHYQEVQVDLQRHQLRAPFAGRVLEILVDRGDAVRPGTPLCRIGETGQLKIRFEVPEHARAGLHQGQTVRVTCAQQSYSGTVAQLGYEANAQSHTFPIEVRLANRDERLLPNMLARLELPLGAAQKKVLVPVSSLAYDGGLTYVYLIEDGRAQRREVVVSQPLGQEVALDQGLQPGQRIAVQPFRLTPGLRVKPL